MRGKRLTREMDEKEDYDRQEKDKSDFLAFLRSAAAKDVQSPKEKTFVQKESQKKRSFLKIIFQQFARNVLLCQEIRHFWPITSKMVTGQILPKLQVFPAATVTLLLLVGPGWRLTSV